jgi:hypothetical protein
VGFVVEKMALGQVSSEYFGSHRQSLHQLLHIPYHPPSGAGTIYQIMADFSSGLSLISHQETKINKLLGGLLLSYLVDNNRRQENSLNTILQELENILEGMPRGSNSEMHCGTVLLGRNFLWHLKPNDGIAPSEEQRYSPSQSPPPLLVSFHHIRQYRTALC